MAKMTPEQKKAYAKKKQAELDAKKEEFKKFTNSFNLEEIMNIVATKGHKYSVYNRMWLAWQIHLREETKIAWVFKGYKQWETEDKLNVLKGSKSFQILAPIFKNLPKKDKNGNVIRDEKTGEIVKEKKLVNFRQVNVFDISQTNGLEAYIEQEKTQEEIVYTTDNPIDYGEVKALILKDIDESVIKEGAKVEGGRGAYSPLTGEILIEDMNGHTLAHEFGHKKMYQKGEVYAEGEIKAELIAFHITKALGGSWNYTYSNIWNSRLNGGSGIDFDRFCKLYEKAEKIVKGLVSK